MVPRAGGAATGGAATGGTANGCATDGATALATAADGTGAVTGEEVCDPDTRDLRADGPVRGGRCDRCRRAGRRHHSDDARSGFRGWGSKQTLMLVIALLTLGLIFVPACTTRWRKMSQTPGTTQGAPTASAGKAAGVGMRARDLVRTWIVAPLAIVFISSAIVGSASGADGLAGSQGIDTSLPLTDSADAAAVAGKFEDLRITVGPDGEPHQPGSFDHMGRQPAHTCGSGAVSAHYLQVMQCWGDDDGSVPRNRVLLPSSACRVRSPERTEESPGPSTRSGSHCRESSRGRRGTTSTSPSVTRRTVDERLAAVQSGRRPVINADDPTFNPSSSGRRELLAEPVLRHRDDQRDRRRRDPENGTGAELIQVLTGVQSTGLGCGQRVLKVEGLHSTVPKCWLVIVPRGEPVDENAGTPFAANADQVGVATSPVAPTAWANRIAVPLEFSPVDSPCRLGDDERQISGNELVLSAVSSWQPALCGNRGFTVHAVRARRRPTARPSSLPDHRVAGPGGDQSAGFRGANRSTRIRLCNAPLTVSGVTIGFNIASACRNPPRRRTPRSPSPAFGSRISTSRRGWWRNS